MEYWLHEVLFNSYLPLFKMLDEEANSKLVLHLSPSLIHQFSDERYCQKFEKYLLQREKMCSHKKDGVDFLLDKEIQRIEKFKAYFHEKLKNNNSFLFSLTHHLVQKNRLKIITGTAAHAFLPFWKDIPLWIQLQIDLGRTLSSTLNVDKNGFWLPECALFPDLCTLLAESGIRYSYVDPSALGKHSFIPLFSWQNVSFFVRDISLSSLIWDADTGYPGHSSYNDFYSDWGGELNNSERAGFSLRAVGNRNSLVKPYYNKSAAEMQLEKDSSHFVEALGSSKNPLITLAFDAELFGHWWHEGVEFLRLVFQKIAETQKKLVVPDLNLVNGAPHLKPLPSTWGTGGDSRSWLNEKTEDVMVKLLSNASDIDTNNPEAIYNMVLAQASDWTFLISHDTFTKDSQQRILSLLAGSLKPKNDVLLQAIKSLQKKV